MNTFIIDIDDTICISNKLDDGSNDYHNAIPIQPVIDKINKLYDLGNTIILFTARGYRTFSGDIDKIYKYHMPILIEWVDKYQIKHHKIIIGKPWGLQPIYVDNRNITIHDFVNEDQSKFEDIINKNCII